MGIFRRNRHSAPGVERASELFLDKIAVLDEYSPLEPIAAKKRRLNGVQRAIAMNIGRMTNPIFTPGKYEQSVQRLELVVADLAMQRSRLAMFAGQDVLNGLGGVDAIFPAHPDYLRRKSWDAHELHCATAIASDVGADIGEYLYVSDDNPLRFAVVSARAALSLHEATLRTAKQIGVSNVDQRLEHEILRLSTSPVM